MCMSRVRLHYNRAVEHYGRDNVLGVFLYGSQNYGCDLPSSDVDTKCILVPDLYHLAIKPYEVKHLHIPREDGEHEVCECMPIQHMISNWKKQNPNFLEILYTEHFVLNSEYFSSWQELVEMREAIAHYDVNKGLKSIAGQALHTLHENPYNGKKQGNAIRLQYLLEAHIQGALYSDCLAPPPEIRKQVLNLKSGAETLDPAKVALLLEYFDRITRAKTEYRVLTELDPFFEHITLQFIQERMLLD